MKLFILCLCFTLCLCGNNYHENELWGKPCIDDNQIPSSGKSAEEVILYTKWILEQLDSYKDEFIRKLEKHHETFQEFAQIAENDKQEWLRKFYWFTEEILPNKKLLGKPAPEETIKETMARIRFKDGIVTKINAALKFILGTINEIRLLDVNAELMIFDLDFRRTIRESMRIIKSIICSMNNYMKIKNFQIEILLDDFLPKNITHFEVGLMLRDTINYFEYIKQLFEALKLEENMKTVLPYESDLWANPCHYSPPISYNFNRSSPKPDWKPDPERAEELAKQLAVQAKRTLEHGLEFKDEYAKVLCSYPSFNQVSNDSRHDEWLRKVEWYQDEVLPKSKQLFSEIPSSYISEHLMKVFPKVLPVMHKGAKYILSGLNRIITLQIHDEIVIELEFKPKLEAFLNEVQYVLCLFSDYLRAKVLQHRWLYTETQISRRWIFPVYRDSLNYLEYIAEVFEYIVKHQAW